MTNIIEHSDDEESREVSRGGRPKGSRNKITLIKLMAEEAVRSKHLDRMLQVCDEIINDALAGDRDCRKLVWQSIMSKSGSDQNTPVGPTPEIIIRADFPAEVRTIQIVDGESTEIVKEGS